MKHTAFNTNSIGENFLKNVSLFPDNHALYIQSRYYTYKELFGLVAEIHNKIPAHIVYDKIGVYCNDSVYDYASMLAVNLYGAAYVPLNSRFPLERTKMMIEECELNLILTADRSIEQLQTGNSIAIIDVSVIDTTIQHQNPSTSVSDFQKVVQPFVYILFTSGTTAMPKGVPVSFENCFYFFGFFFKNYSFSNKDRFLQVYELTFDVSVFSFFMPIQVGACCYVVPNDGIKFLKTAQMLLEHAITVVSMVPSTIWYLKKYFNEIKLPDLKFSFFSGDILNYSIALEWKKCIPHAEIHNFYGPTETTIVCTRYVFDEIKSKDESINDIVPLGLPFSEMEFIFVDENNNIANCGELCFHGKQVINEYLNNSNADKFITIKNKRYYKTGDRASLDNNGNLLFEGRVDNQVKINGYRVELNEINFWLESITNAKSTVLIQKNKNGINEIVAYVSANFLTKEEIMNRLRFQLPDYMIPVNIVFINQFPLTMNGKIDNLKLLEMV